MKVDSTYKTRQFVCDVQKKEWIDKDTQIVLNEINQTSLCVPKVMICNECS